MTKVHLRSVCQVFPFLDASFQFELGFLRALAAQDRFKQFVLEDDPAQAELILFVESSRWDAPSGPYFEGVRRDPVYKRFADKSFVFSGLDWPVPTVRGVFPSIERFWAWRSRARSGAYLVEPNPYIHEEPVPPNAQPPNYLTSFVGCAGRTPVRHELMRIKDPAIHLEDNTAPFVEASRQGRNDEVDQFKRQYAQVSAMSRFILCPRGFGVSSIRLFEAMQMGRSPVVISDGWVAPDGPDWDSFIVRIAQRHVMDTPRILREMDGSAESRGRLARQAWETWFAPDVLFHHICAACQEMKDSRSPQWLMSRLCKLQYLRPLHARQIIRRWLGRT